MIPSHFTQQPKQKERCSSMVWTGNYKTRECRKERANQRNGFVDVEKKNVLLTLQERVSSLVKKKSAARN